MDRFLCKHCGETKDVTEFSARRQKYKEKEYVYHSYYCKKCKAEYNRNKYTEHKETFYASSIKWIKRNPEKTKAHQALNDAIRTKKIIKPTNCQKCGKESKLDGHHWHGYEKEYRLDVQWLCRSCHKKVR